MGIMNRKLNVDLLASAAKKLDDLNDSVVYVGGCATALIINEPSALDVRVTQDVDCIVNIITKMEYQKFEKKLRSKGFGQFPLKQEESIICRWYLEDLTLDIMPTDEGVLGWGNPWYKDAFSTAQGHLISDSVHIKCITAPYFLATKIEAFKSRGNNDLLMSHDFEDIIAVVAGRLTIVEDICSSEKKLREYLISFFIEILENDQFEHILPGHLNDGFLTNQRTQLVLERMREIVTHA